MVGDFFFLTCWLPPYQFSPFPNVFFKYMGLRNSRFQEILSYCVLFFSIIFYFFNLKKFFIFFYFFLGFQEALKCGDLYVKVFELLFSGLQVGENNS